VGHMSQYVRGETGYVLRIHITAIHSYHTCTDSTFMAYTYTALLPAVEEAHVKV